MARFLCVAIFFSMVASVAIAEEMKPFPLVIREKQKGTLKQSVIQDTRTRETTASWVVHPFEDGYLLMTRKLRELHKRTRKQLDKPSDYFIIRVADKPATAGIGVAFPVVRDSASIYEVTGSTSIEVSGKRTKAWLLKRVSGYSSILTTAVERGVVNRVFEIKQIIDENNAICECFGEDYWVERSFAGYSDGKAFDPAGRLYERLKPKSFTTVLGAKRTIPAIKDLGPIDEVEKATD